MNNLFCFHGIDHKVGVTMIAQSTAELIAEQNPDINVLLISLNGRKNCEYVNEDVKTIDDYKLQMDSKMLISRDLMRDCKYKENLYMLAGLENEQDARYYFPEAATYLLESAGGSFGIIIADTGSELDSGLALGGMTAARENYLIMTQLESNLSRYAKKLPWFKKIGIKFAYIIVNKYSEENPYTLKYMVERLGLDRNHISTVQKMGYDCQAELERKTFMEFKSDTYRQEIVLIANHILESVGVAKIKPQKRGKIWKNFI